MNNISQLLTSSINQVFVSSIKTTDTGAPVLQVGGNVEHGDSGGPALNSSGQIVGIVSFGTSGQGSTSFLQASASASTLVQQANVNTTPGPFQKAWSQAFNDYASTTAGHWHKAQQEFQQIANQYPNFKAIAPYLAYTTQQAKTEKIPSTPTTTTKPTVQNTAPLTMWILVGAIIVLALVVILIVVLVLQRRRGRSAPSSPAVSGNWGNTANGTVPQALNAGASSFTPPVPPTPQAAPMQGAYGSPAPDSMTAFGAPPASSWPNQAPQQPFSNDQTWIAPRSASQPNLPGTPSAPGNMANGNTSGALVAWPCGHMNRPIARFCSVCGEPAPARPVNRQYEQ
ncbi:MAG TPA: trypsin-like serine protease, partial [Ktedonobacteraceae bacterium]|nr:trypsin-like serine protease [Ktedonobacteraceae bacterium]